jgi:hypothetical protein
MMGKKYLAILVSANGYGHIRRQILIAAELLKAHSNLRVSFAVTNAQYQRFKFEIESLGSRAEVVVGLTEDSVRWRHDAHGYTDANLNGWESEFTQTPALIDADFVISDNLVGVLEARPDSVLSGSFLWHEVIAAHVTSNAACRNFVKREINLLQTHTPRMICNADLATPAVLSLTNPVLVPWMVKEFSESQLATQVLLSGSQRSAILVHGGGTRTLDNRVRAIAELLRANGHVVYTDFEDDSMCFDYQDSTWQKLGVVISRPGVGTATECVLWRIPMVVLRDQENFEAEYIAEKLRQLGLAHFLKNQDDFSIVAQVREIISSENKSRYSEPFEQCKITGVGDAVFFLAEHWNLIRRHK